MYAGCANSNNWFCVRNRACKTLLVWLVIFAQIAALSTFPSRANAAFVPVVVAGADFVAANLGRGILQNLIKRGFDPASDRVTKTFLFTASAGLSWLTTSFNFQPGETWMNQYCKLKGVGHRFILSENGVTGECIEGAITVETVGSTATEQGPTYYSNLQALPKVPSSFIQNINVNPGTYNDSLFAITDTAGTPIYPIRVKRVRFSCQTSGDWCASANSSETAVYDMNPEFSGSVPSSVAPRWRFRSFVRNTYTSKNSEGKRTVDYILEYWFQKQNTGSARDYFETPFGETINFGTLIDAVAADTLVVVNDNGRQRFFTRKDYVCQPGAYPCQVTTLPGYQSDLNYDLSQKYTGTYNGSISYYKNRWRKDNAGTSSHSHLFEFMPGADGLSPGAQKRKVIIDTTRPLTEEEAAQNRDILQQPLRRGFISPLADDLYNNVSGDPNRIPRDRNAPVEEPTEYIIQDPVIDTILRPVPIEDPGWKYPEPQPEPKPDGSPCPAGTVWDRGMQSCVPSQNPEQNNCPAGTYYDTTARACRPIPEDGAPPPADVGPFPDNPFPTLETPDVKPFFDDLLMFLQGSGPPAFTGPCPTATFYFQENPIELNRHCELADEYSPFMRVAFLALSTITAFLIVLSA